MTYSEAQIWLYNQLPVFHRMGSAAYKADISTTQRFMEVLGNPENKFKSIHIAGTNGKGSSSHLLASILKESGKRTGLHTSPHLKDLRERIVIDGQMCPEDYVIDFIETREKEIKALSPSFFELMVGMAFNYFAKENIDVAVIETGMGGRLDSTNVVLPQCCLITNISFDHQQFLGNTLPMIAQEKAGIIKRGVPVVISQTQDEVKEVFIAKAKELGADIFLADENYEVRNSEYADGYLQMDIYRKGILFLEKVLCPLGGEYQNKNILGVLQTVEVLNSTGDYNISKQNIRDGIENLQHNFLLQGRWQKLSDKPLTICDTGHNTDGLQYVINQLSTVKKEKLNFVLGVVNDKDIDQEIDMLPKDAFYFLCKADIPRGLEVEVLADKFKSKGLEFSAFRSVEEAYSAAKSDALKTNAMVFIGGSTYTVAELLSVIQKD
ncbi:MAG: bifunctional folylpolyglutamate synthase/dihydrofolate synthase [Bacteroidales bacterium]|nr:bifunctional folylpolyglutamate synthase/dihydrofolate synthase [Bacteroidales bacterium]